MSIKNKIFSRLVLAFALSVFANYAVLRLVVAPAFDDLQLMTAESNLLRAVNAIENELDHLSNLAGDWGAWDDTYQFVVDRNQAYIESNLVFATFKDHPLNLIFFYDREGVNVWGKSYDLDSEEEIELAEFATPRLPLTHPLLSPTGSGETVSTILQTGHGPLMVASYPILDSEEQLPARGTLIMGRFLDAAVLERLRGQIQVDFELWDLDQDARQTVRRLPVATVPEPGVSATKVTDTGFLQSYTTLPGLQGTGGILVGATTPGAIQALGNRSIVIALAALVFAGALVLVIVLVFIQADVIRPVVKLKQHMAEVTDTGVLNQPPVLERKDEIGNLTLQFSELMTSLADTKRQLAEQYYKAGMADLTTGILHNVRNALIPINNQIQRMLSKIRQPPGTRLDLALEELAQPVDSRDRHEKLTRYVDLSLQHIAQMQQEFEADCEELLGQSSQLETLLHSYEEFSFNKHPEEAVYPRELVKAAMRLGLNSKAEKIDIELDDSVDKAPMVLVQRAAILQVLSNLITNAMEATRASAGKQRIIRFSALKTQTDDGEVLDLRCQDNGVGIDKANLKKIFRRGFTSKNTGKGGIGLHWCANAVAVMGGHIYVESDGPGTGACFHVLLPLYAGGKAANHTHAT